jgi:hypothetical protein
MSSKEVYPEYFTVEDYEIEVDKSLALGCVEHAILFYHFANYCLERNEDFISEEKYKELCDFLADNLHTLPQVLQEFVVLNDVMTYSCNLKVVEDPSFFVKGVHFIPNIANLLEKLESNIDIDFSLEVVEEEFDSVN